LILFCDTSALVKLYVDEIDAAVVRGAAANAEMVGVSKLAWVELHAALARRMREVPKTQLSVEAIKQQFKEDWQHFAVVETTKTVVVSAGDLADAFALRAYDAVQIASADRLSQVADEALLFACFDRRLNKAAELLGMATLTLG
jgi:predicted nucleic acid-binding protein